MKSVKRTAERSRRSDPYDSAVRFTDYKPFRSYPSSELLGYYHPSALRTGKKRDGPSPASFAFSLDFPTLPIRTCLRCGHALHRHHQSRVGVARECDEV